MTWNLWWRHGPWRPRQAAILATLREVDADIVTLQEVWEEIGGDRQADLMARQLGFQAVARCVDHEPGTRNGNAILSRWPIRASTALPLLSSGGTPTRSALLAEIETPSGTLPVVTTHLSWRPDHSAVRQDQVRALARFLANYQPTDFPPVLTGDLNAEPTSDELRMLTGRTSVPVPGVVFADAWEQTGDGGPGYTWHPANPYVARNPWPRRRVDYVLVGLPQAPPILDDNTPHLRMVRCRLEGVDQVDGVQPSDHYAVVADLELTSKAPEREG